MDHEHIQTARLQINIICKYIQCKRARCIQCGIYTVGLLFYFWKIEHGKRRRVRVTRRKAVRSSVPRLLFLVISSIAIAFSGRGLSHFLLYYALPTGTMAVTMSPGHKERFPWRLISLVTTLGSSLNTRNVVCEVYRCTGGGCSSIELYVITLILNLRISWRANSTKINFVIRTKIC